MFLSLLAHHLILIPNLLLVFYSHQLYQASCTSLLVFVTLVEFLFPFILNGMGFCWLVGLVLFSLYASCDAVKCWNRSENFKASFYLVLT